MSNVRPKVIDVKQDERCHHCGQWADQAHTIFYCDVCHQPTCTACLAPSEDEAKDCKRCAERLSAWSEAYPIGKGQLPEPALTHAAEALAREMDGVR